MSTTSDAERELLEAERLVALTIAARDRAYFELESAKQAEGDATYAYVKATKRLGTARRAVHDAYQDEVTA